MATAERRHPVTCSRCTEPHCCNQLVAVSLLEAISVVRWCDANGLGEWIRGKRPEIESEHRELVDPKMDCNRWYLMKRPCVFLGGGSCMVYDARPYPCRTHLAVSEPEECDPEHSSQGAFVNTARFAIDALHAEADAADESGLPFMHGPMQTMLCVALEYLDRGEQAMIDWLGPMRDPMVIANAFEHLHRPPELERNL